MEEVERQTGQEGWATGAEAWSGPRQLLADVLGYGKKKPCRLAA